MSKPNLSNYKTDKEDLGGSGGEHVCIPPCQAVSHTHLPLGENFRTVLLPPDIGTGPRAQRETTLQPVPRGVHLASEARGVTRG